MAELQIVPAIPADAIGAVCYFHGSEPIGEGVLDTGIFIDFEGRIAICRACVLEAASLYGAASPEKADELRAKNRLLGGEVRNLKTRLEGLAKLQQIVADLAEDDEA
jgi:hypothetical protein